MNNIDQRPNHRPPKERRITSELTKDIYSAEEVADLFNLSYKTIMRMIRGEALPAKKYGRDWRIRREDLKKYTQI